MFIENSKKILNKQRKGKPSQVISDNNSLTIKNNENSIDVSIPKLMLKNLSSFELNNIILSAISPLFQNSEVPLTKLPKNNFSNFKHIAVFIEHMPHYTGGRYSIFHQAVLLSQYTKVTVVTNDSPPFYDDFSDYYNDNFRLLKSIDFLGKEKENNFDLIIGCPVTGGVYATYYAERFHLPLYLILFESPNWVVKYRDGADSNEHFWKEYKGCLLKANKIMVPSHESKKYLMEWLNNDGKNIYVVYPCLNQVVADKIKDNLIHKDHEKFNVLYISRMTPGKSILPVLKKFPKTKYAFILIGKIWTDQKSELNKMIDDGYDITIHNKLSDVEKFEIIADADVLAFPTKFEGFGMPPMEALYMNVPVVTYDLPVLKEIYGNSLNYVPVGDVKGFIQQIRQVCELKPFSVRDLPLKQINSFHKNKDFHLIKSCTNNLLEVCEIPKISVGIINYNGSDYIEYVISSIYEVVNQIIIIDGAVKGYGAEKPWSTDGTLEKIRKWKKDFDLLDKIEIVYTDKLYVNKVAMQNEIAKRVTGDYYVKMDADEIWKKETLLNAVLQMNNENIDVMKMSFYHFWLSFNNVAKDAGGKWSSKHPRIWKWKKGYYHKTSFNYFNDKTGVKVAHPYVTESVYDGDGIYHFGYVRKLKILLQKLEYYKTRGIETYFRDTVTKWKKLSDPTQPTQRVDSYAEKFEGELPAVLNNHPYKNITDIRTLTDES